MKPSARLVAFAVSVSLLGGCAATNPDSGDSTTSASAPQSAPTGQAGAPTSAVPPPLMPAMPLPENAVADAVGALDGMAEDLMKKSGIPGMAVAVVHDGKTVYAKGFGVKNNELPNEGDNRVDADTVFQIASVSKSLSATVVAQQIGKNDLDWDTPVVSKLPWFALSDPSVTQIVTVGDMFSHRSGLPDHAGDQLEDLGYDRRYVLERLRQLPLDPFRISYAYTNYGLTAGAEAVAASAGKSWEELTEEALLRPLGMTSTSYEFSDWVARPDRAVGHIHLDGGYTPRYVRDPQQQSPAGGASSSVNDLTKWLAMVLADGQHDGKQLIDSEALLPAITPQVVSSRGDQPAARSGFYGYGFNVGTTSGARTELSHSGAFELGANSNFVILPSADVGIVVLTNATPIGVPEALTASFADLVQFGDVRQDWFALYSGLYKQMEKPEGELAGKQRPADPKPPAPLASYTGTYRNDFWGPATVTQRDGRLELTLGPKGVYELKPWDGDVFVFDISSENAPPGTVSRATFDGPLLTLEYFDDDDNGVFVK